MIYPEGIWDIPERNYHDQPTEGPALSASVAKIVLAESPRHAWQKHPALNPEYVPSEESKFDFGTAAHELILEGKSTAVVVYEDSWRKKDAQAARKDSQAAGRVALLEHEYSRIVAMKAALDTQLKAWDYDEVMPFTDGKPEQSLIWKEGPLWFKARLDWLGSDHMRIDDLKTTKASAEPGSFIRKMIFGMGYDIQAAMYCRGIRHLTGNDPEFRFVVVEDQEPFGVSVIALDPAARVLADKRLQLAIDRWAECMRTGHWPMYPTRTCYASPPAWMEAQVLEQEDAEETPSQPFDGRAG